MKALTLAELRAANSTRCHRWHKGGMAEWSVTDWATATVGELGEACNAIKKLRRIECGAQNINDPGRQLTEYADAIEAIGEELADTLIYLDLLALRLNIDLTAVTIAKFNKTSERYNFPERLAEKETKSPLAYLATPYSKFPRGLNRAYIEACELAARLILSGVNVFAPIAHAHGIALAGHIDPLDLDFWLKADAVFLDKCDVLIVAHMDGWEQSSGIAHEIDVFRKAGKEIFDLDPQTLAMVKRL